MSNDLGKVSIIVPVYNVEKYFDECINSILNQTYENLEIIIVDDGSTDSCGRKADEFAGTDGRIKVFHKENSGPALARNLGLKHATGDYICFIDSDDHYEPDFVEKMLGALFKENADMVFCNFFASYIDREEPVKKLLEIGAEKEFPSDEYMRWVYGYSGTFCFIWNKIYKKEVFRDIEFRDMLGEDGQIILYIIDNCKKIYYLPDILYHYRRRKSSVVNTKQESMLEDEMWWIKDHMDRLESTGRQGLYDLAQKLYIRKIFEKYHFCTRKTRREKLKPIIKEEMKRFMHNPRISMKLRLKYFAVSLMPYVFGKLVIDKSSQDQYWD